MADYDRQAELEKKKQMEDNDRLTAVSHIQIEHFSRHRKIEGYHENPDMGHLFSCDRLMKSENMFGRIQMGYNPNRRRSFLFANIKTSRYDTAGSSIYREMKEYEAKSLLKGENENRAYVSRHQEHVAVLVEKAENKPWTKQSLKPYLNRTHLGTLKRVMPFLNMQEDRKRLMELHQEQRKLRDEVSEHSRRGEYEKNAELRRQQLQNMEKENLLNSMIYRKEMGSKLFFRKLNYAIDYQKHEMFEFYRERREVKMQELLASGDVEDDDDDGNHS